MKGEGGFPFLHSWPESLSSCNLGATVEFTSSIFHFFTNHCPLFSHALCLEKSGFIHFALLLFFGCFKEKGQSGSPWSLNSFKLSFVSLFTYPRKYFLQAAIMSSITPPSKTKPVVNALIILWKTLLLLQFISSFLFLQERKHHTHSHTNTDTPYFHFGIVIDLQNWE